MVRVQDLGLNVGLRVLNPEPSTRLDSFAATFGSQVPQGRSTLVRSERGFALIELLPALIAAGFRAGFLADVQIE